MNILSRLFAGRRDANLTTIRERDRFDPAHPQPLPNHAWTPPITSRGPNARKSDGW